MTKLSDKPPVSVKSWRQAHWPEDDGYAWRAALCDEDGQQLGGLGAGNTRQDAMRDLLEHWDAYMAELAAAAASVEVVPLSDVRRAFPLQLPGEP